MQYKYGIMGYASNNIGDEVQTLAQMRFLPQIDYVCVRERIKDFKSENDEQVKLIMNAWYMRATAYFPPPPSITPLPISMHFNTTICKKGFLEIPKVNKWLKKHGPIGARDLYTLEMLQSVGIPSYFSSCLTLTLLPNKKLKQSKERRYVLAVNLTEEEIVALKNRSKLPVYTVEKALIGLSMENRLTLAKCTLALYHNAEVVVTRNLHAALPALALETPTLLLGAETNGRFVERFQGNYHLFHYMTPTEFINNQKPYDIDNPPANPETYKEIANKLVATCTEFTGFDSMQSPLEDDFNPLFELFNLIKHEPKQLQRNLYYANEEQLCRAFTDKKYGLNDKYYMTDDKQIELVSKRSKKKT